MRDQSPVAGVFDAQDIASLTAAFDAALVIAHDDGSPFLVIAEPDLRAWLARSILAQMRRGVRDAHLLTALALRELRHLVAHQEEMLAAAGVHGLATTQARDSVGEAKAATAA